MKYFRKPCFRQIPEGSVNIDKKHGGSSRGTVVFKPKKSKYQSSYTMAVIELDGVKYEVKFDSELKIDLPAKRYEFFCYGVCPQKINVSREGGTFILNEDDTLTILFKLPKFNFFGI